MGLLVIAQLTMFVNVETFLFDALVNTQTMQFLDAVEQSDTTDGCPKVYNKDSEAGIVTFNINGVFAQDGATFLNSKGIACRSGNHCAKILNDFLGAPATIRASFYFYTTKEDIDVLVDAVKHAKEEFLDAYF